MIGHVAKWPALGAVFGALLGGADALLMMSGSADMFFDPGEMYRTMWMAIGMCAGAGALLSLAAGILVEAAAAASGNARLARGRVGFLASALLLGLALGYLFWTLTGGPQARGLPARQIVVPLAAAIAALLSTAVIFRAAGSKSPASRRLWAAAFVTIGAASYTADHTVLVRLYPPFHVALSAIALLLPAGAARLLWRGRPGIAALAVASLLGVGAVAAGVVSAEAARGTQNPRFVIGEKAPTASEVMGLARLLVPLPKESLIDEVPLVEETLAASASDEISLPGSPVILLTVDAMRYDRVAMEGDGIRKPAPNMERFAKEAVVFERAYTAIPHTSYAVASLLTGKYVAPLFDVPGAPAVQETWPQILERFRYETGAFFTKAVFFIDRPRFEPYLRIGYGFGEVKMDYEIPAATRAEQTVEFLKERAGGKRPVFTWTHFFEPHEPYDEDCTRFGEEDEDRYDCEIATVDEAIGEILRYVEEAYPEAIVIITADHGEEFGDHGGRYHGTTLYDEQVRVPLLVRIPGIPARRVSQPVSLVDLMGTVLAALDIPIPARVRSRDLGPLIRGREMTTTAFCEVHEEVMAVRDGYKLRWNRETDVVSLYDLREDPAETRSVAGEEPDRVRNLKGRILAWERDHAHVELRPVAIGDEAKGWPASVQRALAGDPDAVEGLPAVVISDEPLLVRRKAAELMARYWGQLPKDSMAGIESEDAVVTAWLLIARRRAGDEALSSKLEEVQKELEEHTSPWRKVALARAASGDGSAIGLLKEIAVDANATVEDRLEAIGLMEQNPRRDSIEALTGLINEYQLSLKVADALAAIGDRASITVLIRRLKRERFPDRRLSVARSLARLDGPGITPAIAGEIAREEPATGVLAILDSMGLARGRGRRLDAEAEGAAVFVGTPTEEGNVETGLEGLARLFLLTEAVGDGGTVEIRCGDTMAGEVPIFDGRSEGYADLERCEGGTVSLSVVPDDVEAGIEAVAAVGRRGD